MCRSSPIEAITVLWRSAGRLVRAGRSPGKVSEPGEFPRADRQVALDPYRSRRTHADKIEAIQSSWGLMLLDFAIVAVLLVCALIGALRGIARQIAQLISV